MEIRFYPGHKFGGGTRTWYRWGLIDKLSKKPLAERKTNST